MIACGLLAGGVAYVANEYNNLRRIVDVYPERLAPLVEKIRAEIDPETYEFLTNLDCKEKPNNPAIEYIPDGPTKVVIFKGCPDYVVKTSKVGLDFDIDIKCTEKLFGKSYRATNSEGGVTKDLFRFAKRVTVAKKLRRIIKENHLDRIIVPKKYLCSFPGKLVPKFSTPFYNRRFFILCERCDVDYVEKTCEELRKMPKSEMEILAKQIHIFFSKSGILDFLPSNYYIKDGKLVIFDTEPMSLTFAHLLCVSPTLRVARINFKNLERNFIGIPEAKIFVDEAKRSITQIRAQERKQFPRAVCITLVFLGVIVLLNYYALLPLHVEYNGKGSVIRN